jgi:uncharacterized protein (DUF4415 family)
MVVGLSARARPRQQKGDNMKNRNGDPVPTDLIAELDALDAMDNENIDLSDMPEIVDWSKAERGKFYRPVKGPVSIRLDTDVIAWFKASGEGYQTRINAALRAYVLAHQKP